VNPHLFGFHCALSPPGNLIGSLPQCPPSGRLGVCSHLPPGLALLLSCCSDSAPQFQKTCYSPLSLGTQSVPSLISAEFTLLFSGLSSHRQLEERVAHFPSAPSLNLSLPLGARTHVGPRKEGSQRNEGNRR